MHIFCSGKVVVYRVYAIALQIELRTVILLRPPYIFKFQLHPIAKISYNYHTGSQSSGDY